MGLVSVIVPVYNVESYLTQAIESLLHQEMCDLEIILIDDGSTDGSGEIARNYEKRFQNIHYIYQNSAGVSTARNRGIDAAQGEYILFLDSDDFFEANSLFPLLAKMENEKLDLLLYSASKLLEQENKVIPYGIDFDESFDSGIDAYTYMRENNKYYACVWYMIVRKDALLQSKVRFVEGILHEDHLFFFQVLVAMKKVACVSRRIYFYRVHANSIMTRVERNSIRFEGFCISYLTMMEMYDNGTFKGISKRTQKCLREHIREIGTIAGKYYIKMQPNDKVKINPVVFVEKISEARWSINKSIYGLVMLKYKLFGRKEGKTHDKENA